MTKANMTDDELHDKIRSAITQARNGRSIDRREFRAILAEFERRTASRRRMPQAFQVAGPLPPTRRGRDRRSGRP